MLRIIYNMLPFALAGFIFLSCGEEESNEYTDEEAIEEAEAIEKVQEDVALTFDSAIIANEELTKEGDKTENPTTPDEGTTQSLEPSSSTEPEDSEKEATAKIDDNIFLDGIGSPIEKQGITIETIYAREDLKAFKLKFYQNSVQASLIVALIDPSQYNISIEGLDPKGYGTAIDNIITDCDLVLGAGFVKSFVPIIPLGLLKVENELITDIDFKSKYIGLILENNGELTFTSTRNYDQSPFRSGFQVGPIIISESKMTISERELKLKPYGRAFVGRTNNGAIVIGISLTGMHLYELGNVLKEVLSHWEQNLNVLYNLSGGGSEGMGLNLVDSIYRYGNTQLEHGSLIVFRKR